MNLKKKKKKKGNRLEKQHKTVYVCIPMLDLTIFYTNFI